MRRLLVLLAFLALPRCGPNQTVVEPEAYPPGTPAVALCQPNLDGVVDGAEFQVQPGQPVRYLINPAGVTRQVKALTAPVTGTARFDLSAVYPDDLRLEIAAGTASGQWFSSRFPRASFTLPFDAGKTVLSLFRNDAEALSLLGFASVNDDANRTVIVYEQPVPIFRFPVQVPDSGVTVTKTTDSQFLGNPYVSEDTYERTVDGAGSLELPDLTLDRVVRVRTVIRQRPAIGPEIRRIQYSFIAECLGEVARITSKDGETNPSFEEASEVRRLGL